MVYFPGRLLTDSYDPSSTLIVFSSRVLREVPNLLLGV